MSHIARQKQQYEESYKDTERLAINNKNTKEKTGILMMVTKEHKKKHNEKNFILVFRKIQGKLS